METLNKNTTQQAQQGGADYDKSHFITQQSQGSQQGKKFTKNWRRGQKTQQHQQIAKEKATGVHGAAHPPAPAESSLHLESMKPAFSAGPAVHNTDVAHLKGTSSDESTSALIREQVPSVVTAQVQGSSVDKSITEGKLGVKGVMDILEKGEGKLHVARGRQGDKRFDRKSKSLLKKGDTSDKVDDKEILKMAEAPRKDTKVAPMDTSIINNQFADVKPAASIGIPASFKASKAVRSSSPPQETKDEIVEDEEEFDDDELADSLSMPGKDDTLKAKHDKESDMVRVMRKKGKRSRGKKSQGFEFEITEGMRDLGLVDGTSESDLMILMWQSYKPKSLNELDNDKLGNLLADLGVFDTDKVIADIQHHNSATPTRCSFDQFMKWWNDHGFKNVQKNGAWILLRDLQRHFNHTGETMITFDSFVNALVASRLNFSLGDATTKVTQWFKLMGWPVQGEYSILEFFCGLMSDKHAWSLIWDCLPKTGSPGVGTIFSS